MSAETLLQSAATLLEAWSKGSNQPEPNRLDVVIEASDLLAAVEALHQAQWGYLSAITGVDLGVEAGQIEVLYHFCSKAAVVTLRVRVPREAPSVPSVCGLIPSVSFYEVELAEMMGVEVIGIPRQERLFLPDDWPEGVYPLRKDFQAGQGAQGV